MYCTTLYKTILYYILLNYTTLYYTNNTIRWQTILHCTKLLYNILYYNILPGISFYSIRCYTPLNWRNSNKQLPDKQQSHGLKVHRKYRHSQYPTLRFWRLRRFRIFEAGQSETPEPSVLPLHGGMRLTLSVMPTSQNLETLVSCVVAGHVLWRPNKVSTVNSDDIFNRQTFATCFDWIMGALIWVSFLDFIFRCDGQHLFGLKSVDYIKWNVFCWIRIPHA